MKPDTSPEYQRFENLLKTVLSVPHSEIKRREEEYKKQRAAVKNKRRAKTSPAVRASRAKV
jgi:hypothetical protein